MTTPQHVIEEASYLLVHDLHIHNVATNLLGLCLATWKFISTIDWESPPATLVAYPACTVLFDTTLYLDAQLLHSTSINVLCRIG